MTVTYQAILDVCLVYINRRDYLKRLLGLLLVVFALAFPSVKAEAKEYRLPKWQYDIVVAVVQQEGGDNYESALWVASTIVNRTENPKFNANTIYDTVIAEGQFEAYGAGHYQKYLGNTSKTVKKAVSDVLKNGPVHNFHYFWGAEYANMMGRNGVNVGGNVYFNNY